MSDHSEQSASLWMATTTMPQQAPLAQDTHADVCVVGAGIAGMTTAYLLAKSGKSVILLDSGPLASGQTQRTTAHLTNAIDDRYLHIERMHGRQGARLAAESHTAAIDLIETIVRDEQIACDFARLDGYLFLGPGDSPELLDQELAAAGRAGLADVVALPRAPLDSFDTGPCLRFPRQGQFHPLKYLAGVAAAICRNGGRMFTDTAVKSIEGGQSARVETAAGPAVTADAVVVATNSPINDLVVIHTKQAPYLTYAIGGRIPRGVVPQALYWDTMDPYHYIRLQQGSPADALGLALYDFLIVGGEDHKTGQAADQVQRFTNLEEWARARFPLLGEIEFRWSGQVLETNDGLAFIGRNPMDERNVFIATGDSGMGMTHGTIAGIILTDLIHGRENPWATLYDPARKMARAPSEFFKENLNVAQQYADWVTPGDVDSADEIVPGTGAIVRQRLSKEAVYRDDAGVIHKCSAVCPHLGCIVGWNDAEKTWDCPCHGSRFDKFGGVINGPANADLPRIDPV